MGLNDKLAITIAIAHAVGITPLQSIFWFPTPPIAPLLLRCLLIYHAIMDLLYCL